MSTGTRDAYPGIPWRSIIGLRNVLVREYDEIRYEILWKLCRDELPLLIQHLEATGADDPPPEEQHYVFNAQNVFVNTHLEPALTSVIRAGSFLWFFGA